MMTQLRMTLLLIVLRLPEFRAMVNLHTADDLSQMSLVMSVQLELVKVVLVNLTDADCECRCQLDLK